MKEKLDRTKDRAVSLATRVRFSQLIGEGRWEEAVGILQRVPDDFPFIDRMIITDPSGTLMGDIPAVAAVKGKNFAFRDWHKGVSARWEPYVSEAYKRTAEPRRNVVAAAAPIKAGDGRVLGALVLQIRIDTLFAWSQGIEAEHSAFIYVVDHHGQLAAHPAYAIQGDILNVSSASIAPKLLRGQAGVETVSDPIRQESMLAAYAPVDGYHWGVVAQQATPIAFAVRNDTLRFLALIYGLVALVHGVLAVIIARTMTAMRTANETAQALNAQLQAANKELEAFSYSVSRDLRAPLRAIDGFSQALRQDCAGTLDETGRNHLQRIHNACGRMAQLIDDLLNLSRLSRVELNRQSIELSALAEAVVSELQQTEPERRVEFSIQKGLMVRGDARLLRIALENLLGNA